MNIQCELYLFYSFFINLKAVEYLNIFSGFIVKDNISLSIYLQTAQLLTEAYSFVMQSAVEEKKFLFVGTKRQAAGIIAEEAKRCGAYYINQRWLGGMLTNWSTIKTRVDYLKELERKEAANEFDQLPKKEVAILKKQLDKLQQHFNGIKNMKKIPDVVIVVDQKREITAIQESIKLGIPTICILDTNCNPELVDIPIPANDDAIRSIKLIISKLADGIHEGYNHNIQSS
uniref:Small ribosomal subunit protein uS2c n=1 Tax=Compsopogon caeruleus TaxID=31354 RepID=A0A1Z1XBB9_9RHOD|nr:chloroplast 30S ribosomal protein S2 [Compsopogon caeruleus]ARX96116.1 chloroplast 30S ribosomal protein S2 [Compsopogon caeruleus]